MNQKGILPYLKLIGSMLIFGTIGVFRRNITLSSAFLACLRGLVGSGFLFLLTKFKKSKGSPAIDRKTTWLLALSGVFIGLNWMMLFEAFRYTTVATASLCNYMAPTIVVLLSPVFLGEKLTVKKGIAVAVSLVGMVLISGVFEGNLQGANRYGILLGLLSALAYAAIVILNKKLPVEDANRKAMIQLLSAALILVPYLLATRDFGTVSFDLTSVSVLLVMCVVHTGVAYALYFSSMKDLDAQSVAILSYLDPVSTLFLSAWLLDEHLTLFGVVGAVMIIGAAVLCETKLPYEKKKNL